ncbi:hypothetical protein E4U43_005222 [Claviceps pusilla]|uniref:ABC-type Fe3+ transport system n=1 Tax=Claviceps pusilla TaxID=123648 RepID=A0A9P7NEK2_9HYPO|nr:hypothetical protein E4U43_005222 [Claviceps pusilla]
MGDALLAFVCSSPRIKPIVESRTLDQIYDAAVKEGGIVTCWHGGDERHQMDFIKTAFEKRFPKMQLNLTVDLSKYHDGRIDQQVAEKNVYVDSVILQTLHDYPRWAREGALLNYAPLGFDQIYPGFKDSVSASWYGLAIISWSNVASSTKLPNMTLDSFDSFLRPGLKNKLVLTYPNDDDAVLFAFDLILQQHGEAWFDRLLAQNPRWVRGTATPMKLLSQSNTTVAASFTTAGGLTRKPGLTTAFPKDGQFVSWAQRGAILKDAPHPEGAKLPHSFMLTPEFQSKIYGWSVRMDVAPPAGVPDLMHMNNTNPVAFSTFMEDRAHVERLRFWFESRIGAVQGKSPLVDDI